MKVPESVTVIIPTYREAENIPLLLGRIAEVRASAGLDLDVVFVDDNSGDGIVEAVAAQNLPWTKVVVRTEERGLSTAVLEGFKHARGEVCMVMDADLSHPPEKIPELLAALADGADFVIGSRYVKGGTTDEGWGLFRAMNSRVATWLALPFTRACDPMSGFFALRRSTFDAGGPYSPVGYKIGLELLVKCRCVNVREVPIHFANRAKGQSKLSLQEQLRYIQHIRRLFVHRYGDWARFAQFAVVGASGVFVNLAALTMLHTVGIPVRLSVALAIFVAMLTNFALNRWVTFSYARHDHWGPQLIGFVAASSLGGVVNYAITMGALNAWPTLHDYPQAASILGILAGTAFNFVASRYIVFRKS